MFTSIDQLKDFLAWCKATGIYHIEVADIKADLMPIQEEVDPLVTPTVNW